MMLADQVDEEDVNSSPRSAVASRGHDRERDEAKSNRKVYF
jgi:hypothetical protein